MTDTEYFPVVMPRWIRLKKGDSLTFLPPFAHLRGGEEAEFLEVVRSPGDPEQQGERPKFHWIKVKFLKDNKEAVYPAGLFLFDEI